MRLECNVTVSASFPMFGYGGNDSKTFCVQRVPDRGVLWLAADLRLSGARSITLTHDDGHVWTWRREKEQ